MDANNVADEKKAATFLASLGKSTYQVLRNLVAPAKVKDKTLEEITAVLLQHYEPKPLVISERFHFNRRQQGATETVADYVAELRRLSAHCEFGTFLDDALRDRFVCGLRSEATQKKLLVETNPTFSRAVEHAQSMESAASKTKQLQSQSSASESSKNSSSVNSQGAGRGNQCYRYGKQNHPPAQCPFKSAKCHRCGKQGHIQPVCRQSSKNTGPLQRGKKPRQGNGKGQSQPVCNVQF